MTENEDRVIEIPDDVEMGLSDEIEQINGVNENNESKETKIVDDLDVTSNFVVHLKGLPYGTSVEDVENFLDGVILVGGKDGIHITLGEDGRPNGQCYVELASLEEISLALDKHKTNLGTRYIEVFRVKARDMKRALHRGNPKPLGDDPVVKVRGLPFGCTDHDIKDFFKGLEIVPNGIVIFLDDRGRTNGNGFVHFKHKQSVDEALKKHKQSIKHRYIEVYRSDLNEMKSSKPFYGTSNSRAGPYDRGNTQGRDSSNKSGGGPIRNRFEDRGNSSKRTDQNGGSESESGKENKNVEETDENCNTDAGADNDVIQKFDTEKGDYISKTDHSVHMRGLPFSITEEQIANFFSPTVPVEICIELMPSGKKNGNANIDFASEDDVNEALKKHKQKIDLRFVEIFRND